MENKNIVHISILSDHFGELYTAMGKGYLLVDELGQPIDANTVFLAAMGLPDEAKEEGLDSLLSDSEHREYFKHILTQRAVRRVVVQERVYLEEGFPYRLENAGFGVVILTRVESGGVSAGIDDPLIRRFLDNIPDAVIITDNDGRVRYISEQFCKLYGEGFSQALHGSFIGGFFAGKENQTDAQSFLEMSGTSELRQRPVQLLRKDGQLVDAELTGFVLQEGSGNTGIRAYILKDVAEQVRIKEILVEEALLNASIARLSHTILRNDSSLGLFSTLFLEEALLISGSSGGCISEAEPISGDIVFHSISRDLSASGRLEEKDGQFRLPSSSSRYHDFLQLSREYADGYFTNSPDTDSPLQFFFDDRDIRLYNYMIIPLAHQDVSIGQLFVYSDRGKRYTEKIFEAVKRLGSVYVLLVLKFRKQAEAEHAKNMALKANEAKNTLLSTIGRELDAPVNTLSALVDELVGPRGYKKLKHLKPDLAVLKENFSAITANILEVVRIESGSFEFTHGDFDLHDALEGAVAECRQNAALRGTEFNLEYPEGLARWYRGDKSRVMRVFANMCAYFSRFLEKDTVSVVLRERRRFNNTSELAVRIAARGGAGGSHLADLSGAGSDGLFEREIELFVARKILEKLRGSLEFVSGADDSGYFELTIPLFRVEEL
ncbi:MAG: PAS domain-containing protein [Spirochaetales bacterium]|nr:PAS domain-containing protein [Spirochaetales bacterium]